MLNPLTLFGILIVSCVMSVAILGSLGRAVRGVKRWCASYALVGAVCSYLLFAGTNPGPAAVAAASVAMIVAVVLLVQGTRQFLGIDPVRRDELAAAVVVCVALLYVTCVSPHVGARVALVSGAMAYGRIVAGTLVLRHIPRDGARYGYLFVVGASYPGALAHLARAAAAAFGTGAEQLTYLQPSPWSVLLLGLAIVSMPGLSIGMAMLAHDQLVRKMERLATIDELTGALTRRAFLTKANALLAQRRATGAPLSVAIVDIDNFKLINDSFGHAVGDHTLTHFAAVVSARLRSSDLFGRIGGEEFCVVFVDTGGADAERLTNAMRLAVEQSPAGEVRCTFSAGVASIDAGDTLDAAMARADTALYTAKLAGRNRVVATPCSTLATSS
jgi:diguanylate cyclase (GGDEF)-like protein